MDGQGRLLELVHELGAGVGTGRCDEDARPEIHQKVIDHGGLDAGRDASNQSWCSINIHLAAETPFFKDSIIAVSHRSTLSRFIFSSNFILFYSVR